MMTIYDFLDKHIEIVALLVLFAIISFGKG